MASLNLLGTMTRVEVPFVEVTIGDYTFGAYDKTTKKSSKFGTLIAAKKDIYPNYIQKLTVQKINGTVNTYILEMTYPITENDDPNFFEKVFSSVSKRRDIYFSYGDISMPSYIYKQEKALITDIKTSFSSSSSTISYQISAVSSASLSTIGTPFHKGGFKKPSDEIKELLNNKSYGLQEIFFGMIDNKVVNADLIPGTDIKCAVESKESSVFERLLYLVSCMKTADGNTFVLNVVDDTTGKYGGPYFKITELDKSSQSSSSIDTYVIDIGYPSQNIVTDFNIENNESFSIFYEYADELTSETTVPRIDNEGNIEYVYAPLVSTKNTERVATPSELNWWKKVTEFPISATITFKGLLRPAILMNKIKLNVYFYGRKHISSGVYIITKQTDTIDYNGFRTTLLLTRVSGDDDYIV